MSTQFVGGLIIKNGNTYQLITDLLGSVRSVVNVITGEIVQRLDYDEYGNVTGVYPAESGDFQPFGFAGGLYDTQTKLVRFGARDYDASVGRWTCKDPIGFGGGQANIYIYVSNDPIDRIDPSGFWLDTGHRDLTSRAMRQLGFQDGIETAIQANINIDKWYNQANSALHYMYDHSDPQQAAENANKYIMEAFNNAVSAECAGNHQKAMENLGRALHTVQDYFSHYAQKLNNWDHAKLLAQPDDPIKHSDLYGKAYQATLSYLNEFQRRTKR